jgi:hypothetical protein
LSLERLQASDALAWPTLVTLSETGARGAWRSRRLFPGALCAAELDASTLTRTTAAAAMDATVGRGRLLATVEPAQPNGAVRRCNPSRRQKTRSFRTIHDFLSSHGRLVEGRGVVRARHGRSGAGRPFLSRIARLDVAPGERTLRTMRYCGATAIWMPTLRQDPDASAVRVPVAPGIGKAAVAASVDTFELALVVARSHCSVMPGGAVKE